MNLICSVADDLRLDTLRIKLGGRNRFAVTNILCFLRSGVLNWFIFCFVYLCQYCSNLLRHCSCFYSSTEIDLFIPAVLLKVKNPQTKTKPIKLSLVCLDCIHVLNYKVQSRKTQKVRCFHLYVAIVSICGANNLIPLSMLDVYYFIIALILNQHHYISLGGFMHN